MRDKMFVVKILRYLLRPLPTMHSLTLNSTFSKLRSQRCEPIVSHFQIQFARRTSDLTIFDFDLLIKLTQLSMIKYKLHGYLAFIMDTRRLNELSEMKNNQTRALKSCDSTGERDKLRSYTGEVLRLHLAVLLFLCSERSHQVSKLVLLRRIEK